MKPTGFRRRLAALTVPLMASACAVGPNYHQPAAPALPSYTPDPLPPKTVAADGEAQTFVFGADISGQWWTLFHSAELNRLIDTGLANNPTLEASQQTLIEAEENERAEQGAFFPSLSGSFQGERTRISSAELASAGDTGAASAGSVTVPPFALYNATLSVSYSPDVFGGIRRQVESLQAQTDYEQFELEAAYLTLTANIVTAAVTEASYRAQIDATNQIIAADQRQLAILNTQVSLGGVPKANLLSERASLETEQATLPPLESALAQTRNELADYVGAFPPNFHEADFTLASLHLPGDLPVSLPSDLVNQRPDIQAAAAQLHEASAAVGVATANMLPQISLTADVGHEALNTATLFTPQTLMWSLVGGITQPIFEGGELDAKRKASIAALRASGAQYQATVLSAFQNVANALQALQYDAATLQAAQLAEQEAGKSLAVTQDQYQLGGQPFTAVLTAQATYQNDVIARVRAQAARLTDTAALFQALGGGWWHRNDLAPGAQNCCDVFHEIDTPPAVPAAPAQAAPAQAAPVQASVTVPASAPAAGPAVAAAPVTPAPVMAQPAAAQPVAAQPVAAAPALAAAPSSPQAVSAAPAQAEPSAAAQDSGVIR
jgi:NodT family efflux transporter outer membrane factor (OMF) lipoprotein